MVEGTGVFLLFDCIVACIANVSARVQPSVRFYSSVFDSVFATVMSVGVLKSILRRNMLWCNLFSSPGPRVLWLRMIRCVLQRSFEVENECNVDCFGHIPKLRKTPSLGRPKQESLRTYI